MKMLLAKEEFVGEKGFGINEQVENCPRRMSHRLKLAMR